jgi:hypothetical protein
VNGPHAHFVRCPPGDACASRAKPRPAGRVCERGWRPTPPHDTPSTTLRKPRTAPFGRPGGR